MPAINVKEDPQLSKVGKIENADLKIFSIPFDIHSYLPNRIKDFGRKPELPVRCWLHLSNAMSHWINRIPHKG